MGTHPVQLNLVFPQGGVPTQGARLSFAIASLRCEELICMCLSRRRYEIGGPHRKTGRMGRE